MPSGKISCCILTEINPEFWWKPSSLSAKTDSYSSTSQKNLRTMKISLFTYSMLGYISRITTFLPHIYRRNSCPTHIFKPRHQAGLQASSHQGIFQSNLPLFGTFVDFSSFYKKLDFPTVNHIHPSFYKQSIFDSHLSKKLPQNMYSICLVDGLLTSIV